jgi:hypothetical protein
MFFNVFLLPNQADIFFVRPIFFFDSPSAGSLSFCEGLVVLNNMSKYIPYKSLFVRPENLALYHGAMQSTADNGANASLAVDFSRSTAACSIAHQSYVNWWAVDLVYPTFVTVVIVINADNAAGGKR